MSFFTELKRRNVFRVGIAYVVGAWLLLQFTEVITELLSLPPTIGPVVVGLVAIGLPIALFLAWAYELTPDGVRRESEVERGQSVTGQTGRKLNGLITGMLILAVGYLLFDKFWLQPRIQAVESTAAVAVEPAASADLSGAESAAPAASDEPGQDPAVSRQSIAVLPFDNRSRMTEDEPFVEGIHDDLLTNLARIGSLKVISRTSVGKYKETDKTIPEIAGELGVATVMEGAVQRSGDTVRINVQLIDANTDEHLWAQIFDRQLTAENLFAIQSEISGEIAKALEARLSPEDEARLRDTPTKDLVAYEAYLEGRQLMGRRTSESLAQARAALERAVARDPEFAEAWAGLGQTMLLMRSYASLDFATATSAAEAAAQRALAIDPDTGEAHLVLAVLQELRGENPEPAFRRAIELSPGSSLAYHWYANYLNYQPLRLRDALDLIRKASELDPLSPSILSETADIHVDLGRYDEAERLSRQLITLDPSYVPGYRRMGQVMSTTGHFDQAALWFQRALNRDPGNIGYAFDLIWTYMNLDDPESLQRLRRETLERTEDSDSAISLDMILAMHAGNYAGALEHARALYERTDGYPMIRRIQGWINNMIPNYPGTLAAFRESDPAFFDPATRDEAALRDPWMACWTAWALLQNGAETDARHLLDTTMAFLEEELPKHVEHPDRWGLHACQASAEDPEAALMTMRTLVDHDHLDGWFFWEKHRQFEPLWNDPRFLTLTAEIRQKMAKQRENLRVLLAAEAEGTGP